MNDKPEFKMGFAAYEAGKSLTENPFHPQEEYRRRKLWGEGWVKGSIESFEARQLLHKNKKRGGRT